MAISLKSLRRSTSLRPPIVVPYGVHGVGKTTWAASAPNPVFLCLEDGLGILDVPSFDLTKASFGEVIEALGALYQEEHDFQSVIVDSLDWLEPKIWAETCRRNGWKSIEDAGYGKGYIAALDLWREFLDGINALRDDKGMAVIMIAHSHIRQFASPETDPYDRYEIKLHKSASALVQEHCDCLFFCNYKVSVVKTDAGFNKKISRGIGRGNRVLYTQERPAFLAKCRYPIPDVIDMDSGFAGFMDMVAGKIPAEPADEQAA